LFPGVLIQGKGLLATEGVVSVPLVEHGSCVAAATSHFFEFMEHLGSPPRLLHELEENHEYAVLLTTGGGLYRYRLGDRVRVVGFASNTPLLEFLGKEDGISDLCGEKLSPAFVGSILAELSDERPPGQIWQSGWTRNSRRIPTMRIAGALASWRRHAFSKSQATQANAICDVASRWASAQARSKRLLCIVLPIGKNASRAGGPNPAPSRR
jgi:hypothetical protein